jgi:hypothetical protein
MHDDDLVELEVLGVRRHPGDDALVVLLLEPVGELIVPIAVGAAEAGAIATAQAGVVPPRPMTHDLLRDVLSTLDVHVGRVEITELVAGVFHAALVLDGGRRRAGLGRHRAGGAGGLPGDVRDGGAGGGRRGGDTDLGAGGGRARRAGGGPGRGGGAVPRVPGRRGAGRLRAGLSGAALTCEDAPGLNFRSKVRHAARDTPRTAVGVVVDHPWSRA